MIDFKDKIAEEISKVLDKRRFKRLYRNTKRY